MNRLFSRTLSVVTALAMVAVAAAQDDGGTATTDLFGGFGVVGLIAAAIFLFIFGQWGGFKLVGIGG